MSAKHTPGPWRVGDAANTIFGPPTQGELPERIAGLAQGESRKANARLIAAAPDLLEACRLMVRMGEWTGPAPEGFTGAWEAAMTANHYKLDNLCAIIDSNKLQIDGFCCDVKDQAEVVQKWSAFGWHVFEVDGHDLGCLIDVYDKARSVKNKPQLILANTIKGAGVSFMENKAGWHGVAPKKEDYEKAVTELDKTLAQL